MTDVGQKEKFTQALVIKRFRQELDCKAKTGTGINLVD